jgi:hypothetical protein
MLCHYKIPDNFIVAFVFVMATLTVPMDKATFGGGAEAGMSAVKSISFFLLFIGLIFVVVGYVRSEAKNPPPRVEFRYVPRTFEQEQEVPVPVLSVFGKMFAERSPWQKYRFYEDQFPWELGRISTGSTLSYTHLDGYGRGVGVRHFA